MSTLVDIISTLGMFSISGGYDACGDVLMISP